MTDITTPQPPAAEGAAQEATDVAARAKDQASGVVSSAKDEASNVAASATEQAKAVASSAASEAKDLFGDARQQLRAQADEQSAKVASSLGDIGQQLRTMAEAGETGAARDLVSTFADQAQTMSQRLSEGGLERTLDDARRLARNRPGLFLAGAALAGFVAARVARSVDTTALKDAATQGGQGANGHGNGETQTPLGEAPMALGTAPAPSGSPSAGSRPLISDPTGRPSSGGMR